jgi:hypothetical protein
MLCLTLTQPWASLLAHGWKRIETRSWTAPPAAIGQRIAVHAAKGWTEDDRDICHAEPFRPALEEIGYGGPEHLERGVVLATAPLLGCVRVPHNGVVKTYDVLHGVTVTDDELAFGDFSPGRWLWVFGLPDLLPEPVPARGSLGLWEWAPPPGLVADEATPAEAASNAPTDKQITFVNSLCKRLHLPLHLLNAQCQRAFGADFSGLDRRQCSQLIDTLQAWTEIPAELQIAQGQTVLPGMAL